MQPTELIQDSLDYIEENLKTELTVQELADRAGYSLYHYERLFKRLVGLAPKQYLCRRRMLHAAFAIADGGKVIDAALTFGFDTGSGFTRAFVREFGTSPREYLASHTVKRPYRICLMQEEHIMITKKTIQAKLAAWGLQDAPVEAHWNPNTGERFDNIWRVGEDLFFKVGTNLVGLQTHIAISRALARQGFAVALPVQTLDDKDYLTEGELCYSLSKQVDGTTLENKLLFAPGGEALARKLGQAIGKLDIALAGFDLPCEASNLPLTMKTWGLPGLRALCILDESFYRTYLTAIERLWPQLPQQMIHRDPNPGNVLVQGGEIVGFLDFELSERNARIYDPCYAATAILSESFSKHRDQWPGLLHAILAGYDETVQLTEAEKEAIPYILYSIQVTCVIWFSGQPRYRELAETNLQILKWMTKNKNELF